MTAPRPDSRKTNALKDNRLDQRQPHRRNSTGSRLCPSPNAVDEMRRPCHSEGPCAIPLLKVETVQTSGGMWAMAGGRVGGRMAGVKRTVRVGVPRRGPRCLTSSPSRVASFTHALSCSRLVPLYLRPFRNNPCAASRASSHACLAPCTRHIGALRLPNAELDSCARASKRTGEL